MKNVHLSPPPSEAVKATPKEKHYVRKRFIQNKREAKRKTKKETTRIEVEEDIEREITKIVYYIEGK